MMMLMLVAAPTLNDAHVRQVALELRGPKLRRHRTNLTCTLRQLSHLPTQHQS
jgi:hypothetical protein